MQQGTRGNPNANLLIVGEAWGADEETRGEPFVGQSGKELEKMLTEAGISPASCYYTNVINKRPANNEMTRFFYTTEEAKKNSLPSVRGLYPGMEVLEGLQKLEELVTQMKPKAILAFGNYALWGLTDGDFKVGNYTRKAGEPGYKVPTGITQFRGSMLRDRFTGTPLVPTYHPAAILRKWDWRPHAIHDIQARVRNALRGGAWDAPAWTFSIRPSYETVMEIVSDLTLRASLGAAPLLLSVDVETKGGYLECLAIAWSKLESLCIPIMSDEKEQGYWTPEEEISIYAALRSLFEHPNVEIVGQNFLYDYQYFFWQSRIKPNYRQDTMLAHHVCFPGEPMGLNHISSMYCEYHRYWKDDGKEATKEHDDEKRWTYNCRDTVVTYEAIEALWEVVKHYGYEQQYAIQMARANSAMSMMLRGVRIDRERQAEEQQLLMETSQAIANTLESYLPERIYERPKKAAPWYKSPKQLQTIFYDVLGQAKVLSNKTGAPTTDDEALNKIARREPILMALTKKLQDFRSLDTFGQFVNMKLGGDSRARCTYSPTTETFRYRSSEDVFGTGRNLQNLPKGNEE